VQGANQIDVSATSLDLSSVTAGFGATTKFVVSTAGTLTFTGSDLVEEVTGAANADTISTGGGNDKLTGAAGADTLTGGGGNDDFFYLLTADLFAANTTVDTSISGGDGTDELQVGTSGTNFAIAGADVWAGVTSVETITSVANTNAVSITLDVTAYAAGVREVDISLADSGNNGGNVIDISEYVGTDTTTLIGADGSGSQTIKGGAGPDSITGGGGIDTITGGGSSDNITVGAGNDIVNYTVAEVGATAATQDIITDFEVGTNVIDFTDLTVANLRGTGGGYEVVAKGANAVAVNTGFIEQNGDEGDLLAATALAAANTMTGWAIGDKAYILITDGTDSAIFLLTENTGNTVLDTAELVVTLTGVDETDFTGANFQDFA
jgi:Ca2+-binding RTX toxin-like protein